MVNRQEILIPKTIGNRKRDCAWGCAWGILTPPEKICRSKSTNQFGERNERLPDLCFSICRFSQVVFFPQAQPHAQSLFLFPIVFGNFIHFFDISTRKNGAAGNSIVCFAASIPCQSRAMWQCEECELFRKVQRFWQRKVWTQRHSRGEKLRCKFFWQGIAQNSSSILRCTFLARRSAKLIANFSATMVTSLPSFSLSLYLSLSLSPNVPHAQYRKRFRASYLPRFL